MLLNPGALADLAVEGAVLNKFVEKLENTTGGPPSGPSYVPDKSVAGGIDMPRQ